MTTIPAHAAVFIAPTATTEPDDKICEDFLRFLQLCLQAETKQVLLVTGGVMGKGSCSHAMLWGMLRSVRGEGAGFVSHILDRGSSSSSEPMDVVRHLYRIWDAEDNS